MWPPNETPAFRLLVPGKVTLLRNSVFADVHTLRTLRVAILELGEPPNPVTGALVREKGHTAQRRLGKTVCGQGQRSERRPQANEKSRPVGYEKTDGHPESRE